MQKPRVMVALDDERQQRFIIGELNSVGVTAISTRTVDKAITCNTDDKPTVAIISLTFGGFEGHEFIRRLKNVRVPPYVILIVPPLYGVEGVRRMNYGADEIHGAPINLADIVEKVRELCAQPNQGS